jgi:hypothetical protein
MGKKAERNKDGKIENTISEESKPKERRIKREEARIKERNKQRNKE